MDKKKYDVHLYESILVQRMMLENVTLSEALFDDMVDSEVDPRDVYQATDYLEAMFQGDMNKVKYYMLVLAGQESDCILIRKDDSA